MTVYLVGAGPGSADLLTLRAATLLSRADVVIHDRLIGADVLDMAAPWAEIIDVGKAPGAPSGAQDTINDLLVRRGLMYDCVVRLKGGDPFVFGRGGEEAIELAAAGVRVEVVPGVTSAIAAPAAAGIPVTMRSIASGFTVVSAHQDPSTTRRLDWEALAATGTTLVILMGAARADSIAERLISAGMAPTTSVAVISSAMTPDQDVQRCALDGLGRLAIKTPATIVVGDVAGLDLVDHRNINDHGVANALASTNPTKR